MRKKSKFLLCLTVTIILSLALPCLGLSVSAEDKWGYQYETEKYTGSEIVDFFRKGTVKVYAYPYGADEEEDFKLEDYLQDESNYQLLFEDYPTHPYPPDSDPDLFRDQSAYLVINFPDHSLVDHKTVKIKFESFLPYYCTTLRTNVRLKKPTSSTEMNLKATLNASTFFPEDPNNFTYKGSSVSYTSAYPKYNGYDLGNGIWKIDETKPFLNEWSNNYSLISNISFNSRSYGYYTYNIDSLTVECGQVNSGGAFLLRFDPVEITYILGNPAAIEREILENGKKLYNRTPEDIELIEQYLARLDEQWRNDQTLLDEMEKVTESFDQLYFPDYVYDWGEVNSGDFSSGFLSLKNGLNPVFNAEFVVTVLALVSPVVIGSYLMFGKKG